MATANWVPVQYVPCRLHNVPQIGLQFETVHFSLNQSARSPSGMQEMGWPQNFIKHKLNHVLHRCPRYDEQDG